MHGGEFNGNKRRYLLNNVYLLEGMHFESPKICLKGEKLMVAFKTFNSARQTCFGNIFNCSYIFSFERAYQALGISITPKVHIFINLLTIKLKSMTLTSEYFFWRSWVLECAGIRISSCRFH